MPTFVVTGLTPAFATAACIGLKGTIPVAVLLNIPNHIFFMIVSTEAVLTKLLAII
jgi:hypothetical protein